MELQYLAKFNNFVKIAGPNSNVQINTVISGHTPR
jgi:hypothetical protein